MVGDAFLKFVIGDPKVQAAGAWLCAEHPVFHEVFNEGRFPDPSQAQRVRQRRRRRDLPVRANIGNAELKEHWRTAPVQAIQNSGHTFAGPASDFRLWSRKWPVVLRAADLAEIFRAEHDGNANYRHDRTEGPIYHAAQAVADSHQAFFDLIRSEEVVTSGTSGRTLGAIQISAAQWSRSDKWIDTEGNDVFHKGADTCTVWCSGVQLRLARSAGARATPSYSPLSSIAFHRWARPSALTIVLSTTTRRPVQAKPSGPTTNFRAPRRRGGSDTRMIRVRPAFPSLGVAFMPPPDHR